MAEIEGLKKQRGSYKAVLTKLSNYAKEINERSRETVEEMRVKVNRAHEGLEKIVSVEATMFALGSQEESKLVEAEEIYYIAVAKLNEWINKRSIEASNNTADETTMNASICNPAPEIKLAKLQIPPFSGDFTEWQSFFDLFCSSIHKRETISPVQKFQYLMGLLKGEAYSLVKHFKVTDANYIEALNKLRKRYDRKRHTINAFVHSFIEQPSISVANASNIRKLLDTSDEVIRGLKALGEQAEARDPWLIYLLQRKLDESTRSLWAQSNTEKEFPTIDDFFEFLIKRTDALESMKLHSTRPTRAIAPPKHSFASTTNNDQCVACNEEEHRLIDCNTFKKLSVDERKELMIRDNRCFNCLNPGHSLYDCRNRGRCRQCYRKHHTLLHNDINPRASDNNTTASDDSSQQATTTALHHAYTNAPEYSQNISLNCTFQTILPTAIVNIVDSHGVPRQCRALIDTASQASFVTEALVQKLGLQRTNSRTLIAGIGQTSLGQAHGSINLRFSSRFDMKQISLSALIIPKITSSLPAFKFNTINMKEILSIKLADPNFCKPGSIDLLLGAEIVFDLFEEGNIKIGDSNLVAHNTKLGWVIGGKHENNLSNTAQTFTTIIDIDATLRRFCEIEEVPENNTIELSNEEATCEEWFKATTQRAQDGRFITKLPFKEDGMNMGSTYRLALSRLLAMERKFQLNHDFKELYTEFLREYQELGHMNKIPPSCIDLQRSYILPHHGVVKSNSTTTKLRVVFDASAKSTTGKSLNQNLLVGPNIQSSLFDIILRFRQHLYVLVGDIEKMYRQVWVNEEDSKHQIILWRDEQHRICPYALKTVTYGTASASFMSTRCLKELALINQAIKPEASRAVNYDIYVDDLMTGVSTVAELIKLKNDVLNILSSGGFNLRKISSNNPLIRNPSDDSDMNCIKSIVEYPDEPVKLLGIGWNGITDNFIFQVRLAETSKYTKRNFLSEASKIFDPLGLLSPITVRIKILFQSLWLKKLEWDEELPAETRSEWIDIRNDLGRAPEIKIPRCITASTCITIHGFCDASKWAYAAVLYARSQTKQGTTVQLICSKTKVAPLKQVSLPRLELMGAVLLSRLANQVKHIFTIPVSSITLWTDSKIVLDWLSRQPRCWTTFVANRTSEIICTHKREQWRHVPSRQNPADLASRGISAREITHNNLWWAGPPWLKETEQVWPDQPIINQTAEESTLPVEVHGPTIVINNKGENHILDELSKHFSSFFKIQKIVAYVLRFCYNARLGHKKTERKGGVLLPVELERATHYIAKHFQGKDFPEEYHCLRNKKPVAVKSKLRPLDPFVDNYGVMRVGGRIQKSALPYNAKHPIILSHKSAIATTITYDVHVKNQHPGINLLTSLVRQKYWIVRGKVVAKKIFHRCVRCLKQNPRMMSQLMGELPEDRVKHTVTFGTVGVDFCGPFRIHPVRRRGSIPIKAYLCIFVCFSTHAIHIEICMNLSTESFLGALRRFFGRRGLCHTIYCDNATNFIGARNHLKELYDFLKLQSDNISSNLLKDDVEWRFIPPGSPHQGGLWESAVKSTKTQITRTIGAAILTLEEFSTLVVQVEGILNSRPICSSNNDEPDFLTPAHFLIGRPIHQLPDRMPDHKLSPHARWDIVKQIYVQFWKRWQLEYLTTLQQRSKWQTRNKNLQLNDIVIIHDNNLPPAQWLLGRVTLLYPGNDGKVRVADVKTKNGIFKRPIQKLCRLPVLESDDDSTGAVCMNIAATKT